VPQPTPPRMSRRIRRSMPPPIPSRISKRKPLRMSPPRMSSKPRTHHKRPISTRTRMPKSTALAPYWAKNANLGKSVAPKGKTTRWYADRTVTNPSATLAGKTDSTIASAVWPVSNTVPSYRPAGRYASIRLRVRNLPHNRANHGLAQQAPSRESVSATSALPPRQGAKPTNDVRCSVSLHERLPPVCPREPSKSEETVPSMNANREPCACMRGASMFAALSATEATIATTMICTAFGPGVTMSLSACAEADAILYARKDATTTRGATRWTRKRAPRIVGWPEDCCQEPTAAI